MTTTDLATIEPEAEVLEPLTKTQAKALDKKIRTASDKVSMASENLLDLLEQAAAGEIHKALELPSWTAWFKDAVQIQISDKYERKELAKLMSGKGMSQRAIAGSLGVSQKTIDRDLEGEEVEEGATVTSLDGAERPKNKAKDVEPEQDYIDAEVVEEEADDAPTPAAEIVTVFADETANLWAAHSELVELTQLEKWPGAKRRVAKANLKNLQDVVFALGGIINDLAGDE